MRVFAWSALYAWNFWGWAKSHRHISSIALSSKRLRLQQLFSTHATFVFHCWPYQNTANNQRAHKITELPGTKNTLTALPGTKNLGGYKKHPTGGNRKHLQEHKTPAGTENTIPGKGNTTGTKHTKMGTKNTISFIRSFIIHSFIHSFFHFISFHFISFPFIQFIQINSTQLNSVQFKSFIHSLIHAFIHSFISPFRFISFHSISSHLISFYVVHSFISFIPPFIRSFIHSFHFISFDLISFHASLNPSFISFIHYISLDVFRVISFHPFIHSIIHSFSPAKRVLTEQRVHNRANPYARAGEQIPRAQPRLRWGAPGPKEHYRPLKNLPNLPRKSRPIEN